MLPLFCGLVIALAIGLTFATAPTHEDFWWTDGATFALNGELIRDYVASGLAQNPMVFASAWYLRYPALTISLYPPIFPMVEAAVFAVFGFSHSAAQATVTAFAALAAFGAYLTMRSATGILAATGTAVLLLATPGVLLWSRQVVMEVPTLAFLLLAAATLLRYQANRRTKWLLGAVVLLLAAVYTKQPAIFAALAFAVALLVDEGVPVFRRISTWAAVAVGAIGLVPLALFTLIFAAQNIDSAIGTSTASVVEGQSVTRFSLQAFTVYAGALPNIAGYIPLVTAPAYCALVASLGWRSRQERRLAVLMLSWFIVDYLFISAIGHFEARYGIFLTVPLVVLTVLFMTRVMTQRWSGAGALAAGVFVFAVAITSSHVTRISGYDAVARYIVDHTNQDDTVLFHGKESKNFTFSVRARSPQPKIFILRAEKILVSYNIIREWGITDRGMSDAEVEAIVDRYGIKYIVLQPDFWTDQPSIAKLQTLAYSGRFSEVAKFPITSEEASQRATIRVFKNDRPTEPADRNIRIEIPALQRTISGQM